MTGEVYRELGEAAWSWVLGQVRDEQGPWLPEVVAGDGHPAGPAADRDSVYAGIGGLAPVLAELGQYRALTGVEQALADAIVARLRAGLPARTEPSLYDGLAGDATALKLLAPGSEQAALARLAELMTPMGWPTTLEAEPGSTAPVTELIQGTAGVVLAAIWAGGEHAPGIAATGGQAMLAVADETEGGLDWGIVPGSPSRAPNYSHGTAGIAAALAIAAVALGRADFAAAARRGAQHLLTVGSLDGDGFIVPHSLPYSARDVEPVTYNWCHGPAGTSQLFAALAAAGVDEVAGWPVPRLRHRCLHSILASGVPRRLRPGRCSGRPARWPGPSPSVRSATRLGRAGGSPNIARTRRYCHRVPRGCKAPRESPPSCSAWPASSTKGSAPRSSTAPTSGGPSRPRSAPSTPARTPRIRRNTRPDPATRAVLQANRNLAEKAVHS